MFNLIFDSIIDCDEMERMMLGASLCTKTSAQSRQI
jgi:hypothetical protein